MPGVRLLVPDLTCVNTMIPGWSSLALIWNGIIEGEAEPVCLGHPCDDDDGLCNTEEIEWHEFSGVIVAQRSIKPRATKQLSVWCASTDQWVGGLTISPRPYPKVGEWSPHSKQYMEARTWVNQADCGNPFVVPMVKGGSHHDTEHIIELQMIPMFVQYVTMGALVSDRSAIFVPVTCEMFLPLAIGGQEILQMSLLPRRHDFFWGDESRSHISSKPEYRLMNALGSTKNNRDFLPA